MLEIRAPAEAFAEVEEGSEGLLEEWLVEVGEHVGAGEPVANAIVVKASLELLAPADGAIAEVLVPDGGTFGPGAVLARFAEDGASG